MEFHLKMKKELTSSFSREGWPRKGIRLPLRVWAPEEKGGRRENSAGVRVLHQETGANAHVDGKWSTDCRCSPCGLRYRPYCPSSWRESLSAIK